MDKELIKNNLLEYAEKAINNGYCDEFIRNNFRFSLNRNRIAFLVFNNEIKSAEIGNILSIFIKDIDYSQDYFNLNFSIEEIKIKLVELFLLRLRFLREKSKIEYLNKNKEKAKEYRQRNKEYQKEYYKRNKEQLKKHQKEYHQKNIEKTKEYQKEYRKKIKEKLNKK